MVGAGKTLVLILHPINIWATFHIVHMASSSHSEKDEIENQKRVFFISNFLFVF